MSQARQPRGRLLHRRPGRPRRWRRPAGVPGAARCQRDHRRLRAVRLRPVPDRRSAGRRAAVRAGRCRWRPHPMGRRRRRRRSAAHADRRAARRGAPTSASTPAGWPRTAGRWAATAPCWPRSATRGCCAAVAALSPAVGRDDEVATHADELDPARTAVWCGTADVAARHGSRRWRRASPAAPAIESYAPGAHTRGYWNRITPAAFAFIGAALTP